MTSTNPLLKVENLKMHFPVYSGGLWKKTSTVFAVDGVYFEVMPGETLGLVGESGCGKTTAGRAILKLYKPTSGKVEFDNKDMGTLSNKELREVRRDLQMIFQDPFESLNPRHTIGGILTEPFEIHGVGNPDSRQELAAELLDSVGLNRDALNRFPHEFSGGQRQRIGIARAIALKPKMIICDEPVSALDVSIQSQIINLLLDFQVEMSLSYLFITHDLAVVKHVSDHIAVMYLGHIVEITDADTIYDSPAHPYTQALISSIPVPDPTHKFSGTILKGDIPSPVNPPSGCVFHTRCPHAKDFCKNETPKLTDVSGTSNNSHLAACFRMGEI